MSGLCAACRSCRQTASRSSQRGRKWRNRRSTIPSMSVSDRSAITSATVGFIPNRHAAFRWARRLCQPNMIVARASCTAGPRGKLPRQLGRGAGRAGWLLTICHQGTFANSRSSGRKVLHAARSHLWWQTLQGAPQLNDDRPGSTQNGGGPQRCIFPSVLGAARTPVLVSRYKICNGGCAYLSLETWLLQGPPAGGRYAAARLWNLALPGVGPDVQWPLNPWGLRAGNDRRLGTNLAHLLPQNATRQHARAPLSHCVYRW